MPTKKRLIIHCGLPRTGTTSIQSFLRANDAVLAERGILYPKIDPEPYLIPTEDYAGFKRQVTVDVVRKSGNQAVLGFGALTQAARRRRNQIAVRRDVWKDFLEQFRAGPHHTALISYEGFSASPQNYDLEEFKNVFAEFDVVGLIYLRRFDVWIKSLFDQAIRGPTRFSRDFVDYPHYKNAREHLFLRKIELINERFFLTEFIVRSFDEAVRSGGLLQDFCRSLGFLDERVESAIARHSQKNASLGAGQTLVLHQINRWGMSDNDFVDVRQAFLDQPRKDGSADAYSIAPVAELAQLRNLAAGDADLLKQRYGVDVAGSDETNGNAYLPYRLSRARFDEIIRSIGSRISPRLQEELLDRSKDLDA